ncbi:MAG: MFS transporter [Proteobacteria bacterium]|nr:MFS transporter [Pseudomonadota bacterium]
MTVATTGRAPASQTRVVALITIAMFINYIDRGNLATAGPKLQEDLGLTNTQFGLLASAFYYSYVLAMIPVGWLAERFGAHRVLLAGVAIWSLATFLTGFSTSFAMLLVFRLLLGIGESASFPCSSKILAQVVDAGRLGVANGVMSFGYLLGPAIGTLAGGILMAEYGWRPIFFVFGALSLVWLLPWSRVIIAPRATSDVSADEPAFPQILRQRALWGVALGLFSGNYGLYFILTWLPIYLVKERGFSIYDMAVMGALAYLTNAVCALAMGWITDRWVRAGRNADIVYKGVMAAFHIGGIACMLVMAYGDVLELTIALFIFNVLLGAASPGYYTIAQIMAGPQATGRWVGVQNAIGNTAGLIAPMLTGIIVDQMGGFNGAFTFAGIVLAAGCVCWLWIVPRIAPVSWRAQKA